MIRTRQHSDQARGASGNRRASLGFTLTEVLIALGILVVLGAIAVPNIFRIMEQTKMDYLDGQAKEIYLAASARLRSVNSGGGLASATSTARVAMQSQALATWNAGEHPADYTSALTKGAQLIAIGSGATSMSDYILPADGAGITAATAGHWVIELHPPNAEVYSVYFVEDGGPANIHSSGDLWGIVSTRTDTSRSSRTPQRLGYYNGTEVQATLDPSGDDPFENASVNLINSEELYVDIKGDFAKAYRDNPSGLSMTLSVEGWSNWGSKKTINAPFTGDALMEDGSWQPDSSAIDIIMDSMRSGLSFAEFNLRYVQGSSDWERQGVVPGSDITVKLNITYTTAGGNTYVHDYDLGSTNSCFATESHMAIDGAGENTPCISAVRHLNNLRVTKTSNTIYNFFWFPNVNIAGDIDFKDANWAPEAVSAQSRVDGRAVNPLPYFEPVQITQLFQNGNGHTFGTLEEPEHDYVLRNFIIGDKSKENTRDAMDKCSLLHSANYNIGYIHIENFEVYGKDEVGGLVGNLKNAGLTFTHNKSTGTLLVHGNYIVGGLVGLSSYTPLDNCSIEQAEVKAFGYHAGGMVGSAQNCKITECEITRSVTVTTEDEGGIAGGMLGDAASAECDNCGIRNEAGNAEANVTGFTQVGGFVGLADGWTGDWEDNSVNVAKVTANCEYGEAYAGGFVGNTENHAYRRCTVGSERYASNVTTEHEYAGGFLGSGQNTALSEDTVITCYVEGDEHVGGFAGYLNGNASAYGPSDCGVHGEASASNYVAPRVRGSEAVGGFVGETAGQLDYTRCYASTRTIATSNTVGGFVGSTGQYSDFYDCYASSDDLGDYEGTQSGVTGGSQVGGFAGYMRVSLWDPAGVYDSYSSCNVRGSSDVGGIIGACQGAVSCRLSNIRYLGRLQSSGHPIIGRDGGFSNISLTYTNVVYVRANGLNDGSYNTFWGRIQSRTIAQLSTGSLSAADSHAYRSELAGRAFPYAQTACGHHYGDWLYVEGA